MNPYLEELLATPTSLPTVPGVVREVMESFSDETVSRDFLSERISLDPVITAKLLRLANCAFYRSRREINSVNEALQMLGLTTVRNVVLGCGLKEAFAPIPGLDLLALWRHGVQTACGARWLARALKEDAEVAFTVGLMQGIGQLVLHKAIPDKVRQISQVVPVLAPERGSIEVRALHFHFADVAAALAQRWNLPAGMVSTLASVAQPDLAQPWSPVAACVHLASWCAWQQTLAGGPAAGVHYGRFPQALAERLDLPDGWWPNVLDSQCAAEPSPAVTARMPALNELTLGLEELLA